MHYSTLLLAALASVTFAAPLETRANSWTMHAFTRTCNDAANNCHYAYEINTNDGSQPTGCSYDVAGTGGTSARQQSYNLNCGAFAISSGWSGQFGPGNGFQTLAVVRSGQIVYPAYSDSELQDGVTFTPDKSYTPQAVFRGKNIA